MLLAKLSTAFYPLLQLSSQLHRKTWNEKFVAAAEKDQSFLLQAIIKLGNASEIVENVMRNIQLVRNEANIC